MKGTPEALYKSGIRASFEQHGVKNVENYLVSTKVPQDILDLRLALPRLRHLILRLFGIRTVQKNS